MRGGLAPALFRGRDFRQEIKVPLAVDQDRDQHLAVLCEQDALCPLLGAQPDPQHKADRPIAGGDTGAIIDHEDRTIGLRLIGEDFRDLVVAIDDRFDGAQLGAVFVQRRLTATEDQRYPFVGVNKAGGGDERRDQAVDRAHADSAVATVHARPGPRSAGRSGSGAPARVPARQRRHKHGSHILGGG